MTDEEILQRYKDFIEAENRWDFILKTTVLEKEKEVEEYLKLVKFPIKHIIANVSMGSKAPGWEPSIFIYADDFYEDDPDDAWSINNSFRKGDAKDLAKHLQDKFDFFYVKISWKQKPKGVRTLKDVRYLYPEYEVMSGGKFWYRGWDIEDVWFILKHKVSGVFIYLLSLDGHGGYAKEVTKEELFSKAVQEDDYDLIEIIKELP